MTSLTSVLFCVSCTLHLVCNIVCHRSQGIHTGNVCFPRQIQVRSDVKQRCRAWLEVLWRITILFICIADLSRTSYEFKKLKKVKFRYCAKLSGISSMVRRQRFGSSSARVAATSSRVPSTSTRITSTSNHWPSSCVTPTCPWSYVTHAKVSTSTCSFTRAVTMSVTSELHIFCEITKNLDIF